MVKFRADIPEEYSVLYNSCINESGYVDVERFISRLEYVEFSREALPSGISGVLAMRSDKAFSIFVSEKEPEERQRFTAAHELGHYFLHRDLLQAGGEIKDRYILKAEGVSDEKEEEANEFAAAFLMPLDQISKVMTSGVTDLETLAKIFGVSIIAMANRMGMPT